MLSQIFVRGKIEGVQYAIQEEDHLIYDGEGFS